MPNGNENTVWRCNFRNCKLERAGPPNQFFFPKQKNRRGLISPPPSSHPTQAIDEQHADRESDVEEQMEANPTTEDVGDPYFIKWDDNFVDEINIDQRGSIDKNNNCLFGHDDVKSHELTKRALFHLFAPSEYC